MSARRGGGRKGPNTGPKALRDNAAPPPAIPKALATLVSEDGGHLRPVFSFGLRDHSFEGSWGWHLLTETSAQQLLEFLFEMGRLSWNEIRQQRAGAHKRHHSQPTSSLCKEARDRITDLEYDDIAEGMFRFRLAGTRRLWGFETGDGVFHVIWWDPDHQVYPTELN
jgi:hypothetical protein